MPIRVSLVRLGGARSAGPAARRAARAPVPAVRVPVVQRAQAGARRGARSRIRTGASSTGSFHSSPAHLRAGVQELVRGRGRDLGARRRLGSHGDEATSCLAVPRARRVLLVKIYDFGVLDWVGRLPVAKLVVFPVFAAPVVSFAFAVLAGIGVQVLWSRDLRLRRFLTARSRRRCCSSSSRHRRSLAT